MGIKKGSQSHDQFSIVAHSRSVFRLFLERISQSGACSPGDPRGSRSLRLPLPADKMVSVRPEAWYDIRACFADSDDKCGPEGDPLQLSMSKYQDVTWMVYLSSFQTTSRLEELLALMVRPSWSHHAPERAEACHQNNIVAAGHGSIISCRVEQPGVVDGDDHEHALCARGL